MTNAEELMAKFEGDKYEFSGVAEFPFWEGRELETIFTLDGQISHPTRRQVDLLDKLLSFPRSIRHQVELELFEHYQNDIYGSVMELGEIDNWEELTPKLTSSPQVWEILGEPTVRISHISDDDPDEGIQFRLSYYGCPWDDEHGFGIQIQDWKIDGFGGEID